MKSMFADSWTLRWLGRSGGLKEGMVAAIDLTATEEKIKDRPRKCVLNLC
jgi:hypothetical protein